MWMPHKQKANDKCKCGSGFKYKKCCRIVKRVPATVVIHKMEENKSYRSKGRFFFY